MSDPGFDLRSARSPQPSSDIVATPPMTPLEMLADELRPVTAGTVSLVVDARPLWTVVYSLGVDGPQLTAWRRAARDDNLDVIDEHLWNRTILAAQCRQILHDGQPVADETGKPVTFHSPSLWRLLGVPAGAPSGATEAVRKFYASDFAIANTTGMVLAEAGYGRQPRKADPTVRSSSA